MKRIKCPKTGKHFWTGTINGEREEFETKRLAVIAKWKAQVAIFLKERESA